MPAYLWALVEIDRSVSSAAFRLQGKFGMVTQKLEARSCGCSADLHRISTWADLDMKPVDSRGQTLYEQSDLGRHYRRGQSLLHPFGCLKTNYYIVCLCSSR
jgi:hypothetical protein